MRRAAILFGCIQFLLGFMSLKAESVVINEVMPCNISTYMDKDLSYNFPGFVEFYNSDTVEVNLKGYRIVLQNKTKEGIFEEKWSWVIDHSFIVDDYKLMFFDKMTGKSHAPYKLDSDGGKLFLYNSNGDLVSSLTYPAMQPHVSYGDGGYMEPTPLKKNSATFANLKSQNRVQKPSFGGASPGVFNEEISITLSSATAGAEIYYTTDGSEPTKSSELYSEAISLDKNKVIRARAYADGMLSSEILTGSFFFGDSRHSECGGYNLPIVSISTNKKYLKDSEIGISTVGSNGKESTKSCLNVGSANYLQDWDRPVNFEYIVGEKQVISHEAEVAVMGGCSRQYSVKSLKIKAGKRMGSGNEIFEYDFFPEKAGNEYDALQIRNGGNAYDEQWIRCRDGFMASIAKVMDIDYQAYEPVAYYINGEYQGLMGLRERTNSSFVSANHGIDEDDIDLIELTNDENASASSGDTLTYHEMVEYAKNGDPSSANYFEKMSSYMDMNEYMDYVIFEHFIVNTDWPGNNCKMWREKDNGRFRWILFDTDFGLGLYGSGASNYCDYKMNSIEWSSGKGSKVNWANDEEWEVALFKNLIKNEEFKKRFLNRNIVHLGSTFDYDRISAVWDSLESKVGDEFCATFYGSDLSKMSGVESMLSFAKNRPEYMYEYLKEYYNLGEWINLSISSNVEGTRFVMNGDLIPGTKFDGRYISGKELKLEAHAPAGYRFSHWNLGDGTTSRSLLGKDSKWKILYDSIGFDNQSWTAVEFDDSKWLQGSGKMGYNSNDSSMVFNTTLDYGDDKENKYLTAYFRSSFNLPSLEGLEYLAFDVSYDDAIVIYINGKEVKRNNITGDPTYSTPSDGYNPEDMSFKLEEYDGILKEGENVISVEVHQHEAKSSDMFLSLSLFANYEGVMESNNSIQLVSSFSESKDIVAIFEKIDLKDVNLQLYISEVAPSNNSETDVTDEYGNHPDWFEIYNASADTIDLAGLYLSDDPYNLSKSQIPFGYEETKLAPKSYMMFWADGKPLRGPNHVDFKLSNNNNSLVFLSLNDELTLDFVNYYNLSQNASLGKVDDISDVYMEYPTECVDVNGVKVSYLSTPGQKNGSLQKECIVSSGDDIEDGVDEVESSSSVAVFPNPVLDVLEVNVPNANGFRIVLYDQLGKVIIEENSKSGSFSLDMKKCPAGIYTLQVVSKEDVFRKLIIKK